MVVKSPFVADDSVSKDYLQYLADLGDESNKQVLADEYASRLDERLGNIFMTDDVRNIDVYDMSHVYLDVNDSVMYDVTSVIKSDMHKRTAGLTPDSELKYNLDTMNQDVLLAGTSNIDYAAPWVDNVPFIEPDFDAECNTFETAYMNKHMAQVEEIFDAPGKDVLEDNSDFLASPAYEEYREAEDCKRNSVVGASYATPHMPMTLESATRAFEKLDCDKDEAIIRYPEQADEITDAYEEMVDYCNDAWGDVGVDVATAQLNAGFNRNAEQGHIVRDLSTEGLESRSAAEVAKEEADLAPQENLEAETENDDIMRGEELDNYVADLKSRLAESRQRKREEAGLSMSKDEVAAAYEDPRFAELKRYTEERRGEKIGPDKDHDAGLEL